MFYATIGSISTGTLKSRDLAETFADELARLAQRDDDPERQAATDQAVADTKSALQRVESDDFSDIDKFVLEIAPSLFEAYCPPFTRFGAHEGDGSDFGVWPDIDSLEEAARYKDGVIKLPAGDEWPELDEDIDFVMEVNDHGNVSVYDAHTREVLWACV